jgi:hypothetical protein
VSRKQNVHGATWRTSLVVAVVVALVTACSATKVSSGTASSKSGIPTLLPTVVASSTAPVSADPSGCSLLATAEQAGTATAQPLPTNSTSVIFTWKEDGAATLCVRTHGDATLATKSLADIERAHADFTGTRVCPAGVGAEVALTFGSAAGSQTAIITLDGCADVFLPDRPGPVVIGDDLVRDLETTAPPVFLHILQARGSGATH